MSSVYIPGGIGTSDGMAKSLSCVNLPNILSGDMFRIVTEERKGGIRRKIQAPKHNIVYPEAIQGQKDLDNDMRRMKRAGRRWGLWKNSLSQ